VSAQYTIKLLEHKISKTKHIKNTKQHDSNYCLLDHRLAHRRMRKMITLFSEIHELFFENIN